MSEVKEKEKTYNPFQLFEAHEGDVPSSFVQRRRVSAALKQMTQKLIRVEASDSQLEEWATKLEALQQEMAGFSQLDPKQASQKLFSGKTTAEEVFQMMDYNPVGGLSNPIAPN